MYNPYTISPTFGETEQQERNLLKQLKFLEAQSTLDSVYTIIVDKPQWYNSKENELQIYYLNYIKLLNADLKKIRQQLLLEEDQIKREILFVENANEEIERELKIVTKEKIEIINEKEKIEDEITKYKVKFKI